MKFAHSERTGLCCTFFAIYHVYRRQGVVPEDLGVRYPLVAEKKTIIGILRGFPLKKPSVH